jgi:hypothetical protein
MLGLDAYEAEVATGDGLTCQRPIILSMMSKTIPQEGVMGVLVFPEDNPHGAFPFAAGSLEGKIVLVRRGKVTFDTKTSNVVTSGGATALLVVDTNTDDSHLNVNIRNWAGDNHDPNLILAGIDNVPGNELIEIAIKEAMTCCIRPRSTLLGLSVSDPEWVRCVPAGGKEDKEMLESLLLTQHANTNCLGRTW